MFQKISDKIKINLRIYQNDIATKGLYWSIIHRLYKIPTLRKELTPIVNILKPDYVMAGGHKLYIDKWDTTISQELILSGKWEDYETELFKKNIKPGVTVVDIGAHIGYYTVIAAQLVGDKGKVYAFEPDPRNFKLLQRNVEANGYSNVVLVNKAVSDKIEEKRVDIIKMDIQGAEARAFQGAMKVIARNRHIKLITEFYPQALQQSEISAEEYLALLQKHAFKLFNIDEVKRTTKPVTNNQLLASYPLAPETFTNLLCVR